MKPVSHAKLSAYQRHWRAIHAIQDELSRQYIHENLSLRDVSSEAQLDPQTVNRFFHRGKGAGHSGYSLFHGPKLTTVVGIASAIGLQLQIKRNHAHAALTSSPQKRASTFSAHRSNDPKRRKPASRPSANGSI